MGEKYIKKEGGKEVVYEKNWIGGDTRVGELHKTSDGSKETRNAWGPNVRVEGEKHWFWSTSQDRKASVDGEEGNFRQSSGVLGFGRDTHPIFRPDQSGDFLDVFDWGSSGSSSRSSSPSSESPSYSSGSSGGGSYSRSSSPESSSYGGSSYSHSSSGSGLGLLIGGAIVAVFLGGLYFSVLDAKEERLQREQRYSEQTRIRPQNSRAVQYRAKSSQTRHEIAKPDTSRLLEPGPPLPDKGVYYTFDITSSSNNERVMRINYYGNLLRRERTYTIDRRKYPEVYTNLDINEDGEVSMTEFIKHEIIFTNQKIAEGVRKGDIESLVDKILKATYGLCFTDTAVYYTLDCPVDVK